MASSCHSDLSAATTKPLRQGAITTSVPANRSPRPDCGSGPGLGPRRSCRGSPVLIAHQRLLPALDEHRELLRTIGYIGGREDAVRRFGAVFDIMAVQKRANDGSLDGEVNVLRNVSNSLCDLNGVNLGRNDANDVSTHVEQRATAIPRLNGSRDLQHPTVVPKPSKGRDETNRQVPLARSRPKGT